MNILSFMNFLIQDRESLEHQDYQESLKKSILARQMFVHKLRSEQS